MRCLLCSKTIPSTTGIIICGNGFPEDRDGHGVSHSKHAWRLTHTPRVGRRIMYPESGNASRGVPHAQRHLSLIVQGFREQTQHETFHDTSDTRRDQDGRCSHGGTLQYHHNTEPPVHLCPALQRNTSMARLKGQ